MKKVGIVILGLASMMEASTYKKEETVIAFDLHEVVFTFSYKKFAQALYTFFKKDPWHHLGLLNPLFVYRTVREFRNNSRVAENIYFCLGEKYYPRLHKSMPEFINICNVYDINPEMEKLVRQLKKEGYRITVCSNIGKRAYEAFYERHKEFFDLCEVIVVSEPEDGYIRKPAVSFFEKFKQTCYKTFKDAHLVFYFIDDKKRNIKAAQKAGLQGCLFKNVYQLKKYLREQGVELEKTYAL